MGYKIHIAVPDKNYSEPKDFSEVTIDVDNLNDIKTHNKMFLSLPSTIKGYGKDIVLWGWESLDITISGDSDTDMRIDGFKDVTSRHINKTFNEDGVYKVSIFGNAQPNHYISKIDDIAFLPECIQIIDIFGDVKRYYIDEECDFRFTISLKL